MLRRSTKTLLVLAACLAAGAARAQGSSRGALAGEALDQSRNNPSLYQSAPITHVIPAFNTITYALGLDYVNDFVTPKDKPSGPTNEAQTLKLGGYTATPYLAVSLRQLGIGFSAEDGQRTARYDDDWTRPAGQTLDQSTYQKSQADYTALGVYLYLIPFPQTTAITPTVILGAKNYNVRHVFGHDLQKSPPPQPANVFQGDDSDTYRYSLTRYEFGLNVPIQLLRRFMLIPWLDYNYVDTREAQGMSKDSNFQDDVQLFWHSDPKLRYGLDFAIKVDRFEVHLGSLFGALAPLGQSVPYVQDKSLSLSLSFDQKGS